MKVGDMKYWISISPCEGEVYFTSAEIGSLPELKAAIDELETELIYSGLDRGKQSLSEPIGIQVLVEYK